RTCRSTGSSRPPARSAPGSATPASPATTPSRSRSRCRRACSNRQPSAPTSRRSTACTPRRCSPRTRPSAVGETYAAAGVSIEAGDAAVERIKPLVRSTYRPEVLGDIGGFGGLFDIAALGMRRPVLVSTTDGVGTKALVATMAQRYDTIGLDLVAMCVDDLVCQGAQP